jgi:hypothetical protein
MAAAQLGGRGGPTRQGRGAAARPRLACARGESEEGGASLAASWSSAPSHARRPLPRGGAGAPCRSPSPARYLDVHLLPPLLARSLVGGGAQRSSSSSSSSVNQWRWWGRPPRAGRRCGTGAKGVAGARSRGVDRRAHLPGSERSEVAMWIRCVWEVEGQHQLMAALPCSSVGARGAPRRREVASTLLCSTARRPPRPLRPPRLRIDDDRREMQGRPSCGGRLRELLSCLSAHVRELLDGGSTASSSAAAQPGKQHHRGQARGVGSVGLRKWHRSSIPLDMSSTGPHGKMKERLHDAAVRRVAGADGRSPCSYITPLLRGLAAATTMIFSSKQASFSWIATH